MATQPSSRTAAHADACAVNTTSTERNTMRYQVILDTRQHGGSIGSTDDIIEAAGPAEAEQDAIAQWKALRPNCTFHPLLTLELNDGSPSVLLPEPWAGYDANVSAGLPADGDTGDDMLPWTPDELEMIRRQGGNGSHPYGAHGTFYRVLNYTGYGDDYWTFDEALANANTKFHSPLVSVSIATRVRDAQGEREVARTEVPNPLTDEPSLCKECGWPTDNHRADCALDQEPHLIGGAVETPIDVSMTNDQHEAASQFQADVEEWVSNGGEPPQQPEGLGGMGYIKDSTAEYEIVGEHRGDWVVKNLGAGTTCCVSPGSFTRVHEFDSTSEAYNVSQCDEAIRDGDVLVVKQEGVIGVMVAAWPTAITPTHGSFHQLADGLDWETFEGARYAHSYAVAQRVSLDRSEDTCTVCGKPMLADEQSPEHSTYDGRFAHLSCVPGEDEAGCARHQPGDCFEGCLYAYTRVDRPHRFQEGDLVTMSDSTSIVMEVVEERWLVRNAVAYPAYQLRDVTPGSAFFGEVTEDDVLDTLDLVESHIDEDDVDQEGR